MLRHHRLIWLGIGVSAALRADIVQAGMPSLRLTDLAWMRLSSISFFFVGTLLSAAGVRWLWNYLQRDFTRLPKLSYGKALGLTVVWGLLFVLVLTMISGARELMTPGAWEQKGFTYKLKTPATEDGAALSEKNSELLTLRRRQLDALKTELWRYADSHANQFPGSDQLPEIPAQAWELPDRFGTRYRYFAGHTRGGVALLVSEPDVYDSPRLGIWTDGTIGLLKDAPSAKSSGSAGR